MCTIRPAKPKDFLSVASLDREAWKSNANHEFIPDGEHIWRIWCEHAIVFVAELDANIVGAILSFACEAGSYCIHKVFVDSNFRNKNIGSLLFQSMLQETDRKHVSTFLTVDPNNASALALYENWGYEKSELIKRILQARRG